MRIILYNIDTPDLSGVGLHMNILSFIDQLWKEVVVGVCRIDDLMILIEL